MDGRKEEKKQMEPVVDLNNIPLLNHPSNTSFYPWLAHRGAFVVMECAIGNEALGDASDLARPDSDLKEEVRIMPFQNKRRSDADLETSAFFSKKQTPPVSPKLPSRRLNNSPLLFSRDKEKNLDVLPSETPVCGDDFLPPQEQVLLDALLKELSGKPAHLLIAEKAIAQQRMLDQQPFPFPSVMEQ
jgi:hypothetical protein